jgi:hypothetical protein
MSSAIRDEFPGRGKEYKKSAEETMARVGSTVDSNVEEGLHFHHLPYILLALLTPSLGKQRISEGVQKFDEAKEKAKHNVMGKIDEVDRKIETEASKAKGGIMSWFGK